MDEYTYCRTVGEGAYGSVWLTQRRGGSYCAVKVFKQAHEDAEIKALAKREARILQSISHVNCVKLLDAFKSKSGRVYLVFEYVPRNVFSELDAHPDGLPSALTKLITWQLLHALAYLHDRKIVHRDIKPANILLTHDGVVKLCDFGFARCTACGPRDVQGGMSTYCVTRWYRPPEVLVSDHYGPSADVWSIGCTVAEIATGRPLFPGRSTPDQLWRIMRCLGPLAPHHLARLLADTRLRGVAVPPHSRSLRQRLPELEPRLFQLVEACLAPNPALRPTAAELLQMPYFWDVQRLVVGTPLAGLYGQGGGGGAAGRSAGGGEKGGGGGGEGQVAERASRQHMVEAAQPAQGGREAAPGTAAASAEVERRRVDVHVLGHVPDGAPAAAAAVADREGGVGDGNGEMEADAELRRWSMCQLAAAAAAAAAETGSASRSSAAVQAVHLGAVPGLASAVASAAAPSTPAKAAAAVPEVADGGATCAAAAAVGLPASAAAATSPRSLCGGRLPPQLQPPPPEQQQQPVLHPQPHSGCSGGGSSGICVAATRPQCGCSRGERDQAAAPASLQTETEPEPAMSPPPPLPATPLSAGGAALGGSSAVAKAAVDAEAGPEMAAPMLVRSEACTDAAPHAPFEAAAAAAATVGEAEPLAGAAAAEGRDADAEVVCAITGPLRAPELVGLVSPVAALEHSPTASSSPSTAAAATVSYVRTLSAACSAPSPAPPSLPLPLVENPEPDASPAAPERAASPLTAATYPAPLTPEEQGGEQDVEEEDGAEKLQQLDGQPTLPPADQRAAGGRGGAGAAGGGGGSGGDSDECEPGEECDWVSELRGAPNPRASRAMVATRRPAAAAGGALHFQALLMGDSAAVAAAAPAGQAAPAWPHHGRFHLVEHGSGATSDQLPTLRLNTSASAAALTFSAMLPAALGMEPGSAAEAWLSCQPLGPIVRAAIAATASVDGAGAAGVGAGAGAAGGSDTRLGRLFTARRTAPYPRVAGGRSASLQGAASAAASGASGGSGASRSGSGMDVGSGFLRPLAASMAARAAAGNRIAMQAAAAAAAAVASGASWRFSLGGAGASRGSGSNNFAFPSVSSAGGYMTFTEGVLLQSAEGGDGGGGVGGGGGDGACDTLPLGEPLRGQPDLPSAAAAGVPPPHRRPQRRAAPWVPPSSSAANSESLFPLTGTAARGGQAARRGPLPESELCSPPTNTGATGCEEPALVDNPDDGGGDGGGGGLPRGTRHGGPGLVGSAWGTLMGRLGRGGVGVGGSGARLVSYGASGSTSAGGAGAATTATGNCSASTDSAATAATAIPAGRLMRRSLSNRSGARSRTGFPAAAGAASSAAARSRLASEGPGTDTGLSLTCSPSLLATSPGGPGGGGGGSSSRGGAAPIASPRHHRNRHNPQAAVPASFTSALSNDWLTVMLAAGVQLSPVEGGVGSSAVSMARPLSAVSRSREAVLRGAQPAQPDAVVGSFGMEGGGALRDRRAPPSCAASSPNPEPAPAPATPVTVAVGSAGASSTTQELACGNSSRVGGGTSADISGGAGAGAGTLIGAVCGAVATAGACIAAEGAVWERPSSALASCVLGPACKPAAAADGGKKKKRGQKTKKGFKALWRSVAKALGLHVPSGRSAMLA